MFEQNDKALTTYRTGCIVALIICIVGCLIAGIALAVIIHWTSYIFIVPCGISLCDILWLRVKVHLSYLCDIKLIRNKLYGESNEGLDDFLKTFKERVDEVDEDIKKEEEKEAELAHLYQLMEQGLIAEDEYKKREKELDSD